MKDSESAAQQMFRAEQTFRACPCLSKSKKSGVNVNDTALVFLLN